MLGLPMLCDATKLCHMQVNIFHPFPQEKKEVGGGRLAGWGEQVVVLLLTIYLWLNMRVRSKKYILTKSRSGKVCDGL